jgi:hypothetical protein
MTFRLYHSIFFFFSVIIDKVNSQCNTTLYSLWQVKKYEGVLATDSDFWRYQTQTEFILTNKLALTLAVAACQRRFNNLELFRAGRLGPVNIQDSYKIMCKPDCMESDNIHQQVMELTGCDCLELSTQTSDPSYHKKGDWCDHNSARILCNSLGYCGTWKCKLDDFMCPRYEWNKKYIPFKGYGTCIRGKQNSSDKSFIWNWEFTFLICIIMFIYNIYS